MLGCYRLGLATQGIGGVQAIARYRLDSDDSGNVHIVRDDDNGADYLYVMFQALRYYVLRIYDNQRRAESILDDIQNEIHRRSDDGRGDAGDGRNDDGGS
jgi:hypothetical protein